MNVVKKLSIFAGAGLITLGIVGEDRGLAVTLTFEGVGDVKPVGNFYDTSPNDFNIIFSPNTFGGVDTDAGGSIADFSNEPSSSTAVSSAPGSAPITLTSLDGLIDSVSFFYVNPFSQTTVTVFSGPNATGSILATQSFPITPTGSGDPNGGFNTFTSSPVSVPFSGVAQSVQFSDGAASFGIDDVTVQPIPEPSSILAFLTFGGLASRTLLKGVRKKNQN